MKRNMKILLIGAVLCVISAGCGRASHPAVQDGFPVADAADTEVRAETQTETQNADETAPLPEGEYVYDYQVSMDPIPKEIADLGGPCQGTIHAFPSRIRIGLTQKMMEEDPELKAEVEKRIPEVEQYLEENIGGEFRVDGVDALDELDWVWFCTEVETEYQFELGYTNHQYAATQRGSSYSSNNRFFLSDYYIALKTAGIAPDMEALITDVFGEVCYAVRVTGDFDDIKIYVIQFTDENIDRMSEQVKILDFWKMLKDYDNDRYHTLFLAYFPASYQNMAEYKYGEGTTWDMILGDAVDNIDAMEILFMSKEVYACLYYDEFWMKDNDVTLDKLLTWYESGLYDETRIWQYWVEAE